MRKATRKSGLSGVMAVILVGLGIVLWTNGDSVFVDSTGVGGAYTTIEVAFTAAGANDTIYVRGGQTFAPSTLAWGTTKSGVKLYGGWDGNQVAPESNAHINPNTAGDLAVANPARLTETVISGSGTLRIAGVAGDVVSDVTIRGFDFQKTATVIDVNPNVNSTSSNLDLSYNKITITIGQGINFQQASQGSSQGVLIAGNRITFDASASARTAIQLGPGSPTLSHVTVLGNYIVDQSSATGNNRAVNADRGSQLVFAGNLFDALSNQSVGNLIATKDVVIAENEFLGAGKTQRAILAYPLSATEGDQDVKRILISNNTASGHVGQVIDWTIGGNYNNFTGDDGSQDIWIRHNQFDADAAQMQASTFNGVTVVSLRLNENTEGNGPVEITHNEINLIGNRTSYELQAIRIAGQAPTAATGGMLIEDNVITATDASGTNTLIGIRIAPGLTPYFGTMGDIDATIQNNTISGFLTAGVGIYNYDGTVTNPPTVGNLDASATVSVGSDNILTNGIGVEAGGGATIDIGGSYFDGNTNDTIGNVSGTAGVAANAVAGRNSNYVTFRGDFNLDNAVSDADRLVWTNNFGTVGPVATYFNGDTTIDQMVSAADLLVWKRYNGLDINASAAAPAPVVSPGAPIVKYYPVSGKLTIDGRASTAWAFEFAQGAAPLNVSAHTEGNLGASWLYGAFADWPATNRFEFVDATAGGSTAPASVTEVATLQTKLSAEAFGPVTYYVGSNTFQTTVRITAQPTLLLLQ